MTPQEIIAKWLGKRVDYDGTYWYQCVDWAKQFAKEYGAPLGSFGGSAYSGWMTGQPFDSRWERVPNTPEGVPPYGAIVFLDKTKTNPYGHVAVWGDSTANELVLIEQNAADGDGDGEKGNEIVERKIAYNSKRGACLGWYCRMGGAQLAKKLGFWNGERPNDTLTRLELATMVIRASKKPSKGIWNGLDPNNKASATEMQIMTTRGFGIACDATTRETLAEFCYDHKK